LEGRERRATVAALLLGEAEQGERTRPFVARARERRVAHRVEPRRFARERAGAGEIALGEEERRTIDARRDVPRAHLERGEEERVDGVGIGPGRAQRPRLPVRGARAGAERSGLLERRGRRGRVALREA